MKILFLDTSSFFVTVAILDGDKVLYEYKSVINDDMSSKVMPIISDAFTKVSFSIKNIDRIFVVNGPGSFTGVRIGVSIAKTLAWALKKPISTISSLEYLATTPCKTDYIMPMIDARRGYVFAGVYDSDLNKILDDRYVDLSNLKKYFEKGTIVSFNDLDNSITPDLNVQKIINKHINDKPIEAHLVKPNYLKRTEAEERLMEKNND